METGEAPGSKGRIQEFSNTSAEPEDARPADSRTNEASNVLETSGNSGTPQERHAIEGKTSGAGETSSENQSKDTSRTPSSGRTVDLAKQAGSTSDFKDNTSSRAENSSMMHSIQPASESGRAKKDNDTSLSDKRAERRVNLSYEQ